MSCLVAFWPENRPLGMKWLISENEKTLRMFNQFITYLILLSLTGAFTNGLAAIFRALKHYNFIVILILRAAGVMDYQRPADSRKSGNYFRNLGLFIGNKKHIGKLVF